MEIDITTFVKNNDPHEFSANRMELGNRAGEITWSNAKHEAADAPLLPASALAEFRDWVSTFGAWEAKEIAAWDATECNAILIQYISGDLRELENLCYSDNDEYGIDWPKAEALSSAGTIGGNIFRGGDDHIYFYMGI
jgi:hypothetical protein